MTSQIGRGEEMRNCRIIVSLLFLFLFLFALPSSPRKLFSKGFYLITGPYPCLDRGKLGKGMNNISIFHSYPKSC